MKKFITSTILLMILTVLFTANASAQTICRTGGSGINTTRSCISDTTISSVSSPMSSVHYFPNGGSITRSVSTSTSLTLSSSWSYSVSLWDVLSIGHTFGVSFSVTQSIGISASWTVKPKQYARIEAVFPRKNMVSRLFTGDGALISSRTGDTNQSTGYYITAKVWY